MKQKDIALIIVISAISAVIALGISHFTIGAPKNRQQKAEIVEKISADFTDTTTPEFKKYFNAESIDPTQVIRIGNPNATN